MADERFVLEFVVDDRGAIRATDRMGKEVAKVGRAAKETGGSLGKMAAIGAGIGAAVVALRSLSGAARFATSATFGMNAQLETSTLQFATLMGNTERAEAHVRSLFTFAARTPFETGPIIEASRMMQTFGGDALNTTENLELLGDASAATGAPINELGFWVGRLFSQLQAGRPFGEAAQRLQELAVLSPQARNEMEALQEAGKSASEIFAFFQGDLEKFTGGMVRQASTWEGVTSTFTDSVQLMIADAMQPLFEAVREGLAQINALLSSPQMLAAANAVKEAIANAFGGDQQERVNTIRRLLLGFAASAVEAALVVKKAWQGVEVLWNGLKTTILFLADGIVGLVEVLLRLTNSVTGFDKIFPQLEGHVRAVSQRLEEMRAAAAENTAESFRTAQGASDADVALAMLATSLKESATQYQAVSVAGADVVPVVERTGEAAATSGRQAAEAAKEWETFVKANSDFIIQGPDRKLSFTQAIEGFTRLAPEVLETTTLSMRFRDVLPSVTRNITDLHRALNPPGAGGFFGGFVGGLRSVLTGLTGGGGVSGFLSNIGVGIAEGFGNIISGGISSLVSGAIGLVSRGFRALWRGITGGPSEAELQGREFGNNFIDGVIQSADVSSERVADAVAQGWDPRLAEFALAAQDVFTAAGLSVQDAMQWVQRFFDGIKDGPAALQPLIEQFQHLVDQAHDLDDTLDQAMRPRTTEFTIVDSNGQVITNVTGDIRPDSTRVSIRSGGEGQSRHQGGLVEAFPFGGMVGGLGDHVNVLAQPGEFVMRRSAVNRIGLPALSAMNAGTAAPTIAIDLRGSVVASDRAIDDLTDAISQRLTSRLTSRVRVNI